MERDVLEMRTKKGNQWKNYNPQKEISTNPEPENVVSMQRMH
jgi:hypothetical protein